MLRLGIDSSLQYLPWGVELANNVRQAWWRWMVYERDDIEGLDSSIIGTRWCADIHAGRLPIMWSS